MSWRRAILVLGPPRTRHYSLHRSGQFLPLQERRTTPSRKRKGKQIVKRPRSLAIGQHGSCCNTLGPLGSMAHWLGIRSTRSGGGRAGCHPGDATLALELSPQCDRRTGSPRQDRFDRIVDVIRESPETHSARELRLFLGSPFNQHHATNLWRLKYALDSQRAAWTSGHVPGETLRRASVHAGEFEPTAVTRPCSTGSAL